MNHHYGRAKLLPRVLTATLFAAIILPPGTAVASSSHRLAQATPAWLAKIDAAYQQGIKPITTWPGPTSSFPAKDIKGPMSFASIPCSAAISGCQVQAQGFVAAAHALGWKVKEIDAKGDPSDSNNAMAEAIALHVKGIFEVSIDPHTISGEIAAARKAGIVVIAGATGTGTEVGVAHEVSLYGYQEGVLMADAIVARTGGHANVAIFNDAESSTITQRVQGSLSVFRQCLTCKVVVDEPVSYNSLGSVVTSQVQGILQAHPSINVIWCPYDAAATDMVLSVKQAGRANDTWIGSYNGLAQNLAYVRSGNVEQVDIGEALSWEGWAAADDFIRIFTGHKPVNDGVPHQILVKGDLPPAGTNWDSNFNYPKKYEQLWGIAS